MGVFSNRFEFRLTDHEASLLQQKCTKLGLTKAQFLRMCIALPIDFLSDSQQQNQYQNLIGISKDQVSDLLIECKRWGNNFNQGTRAMNIIGKKYYSLAQNTDFAKEVIKQCAVAQENMRAAYDGIKTVEDKIKYIADNVGIVVPL